MATEVEGINDLLRNIANFKDVGTLAAASAMAVVTKETATNAQQNHSFQNRTGNLEASIQPLPVEVAGSQVEGFVRAGMEYAPFVEFGTSRSAPYPFLRPAVEANQERLKTVTAEAVARALSAAKVER